MYQSPDYWKLEARIAHWDKIKRYVDLARTFRAMRYSDTLTIASNKTMYVPHSEHQVILQNVMRVELCDYMADRFETLARTAAQETEEAVDIKGACSV